MGEWGGATGKSKKDRKAEGEKMGLGEAEEEEEEAEEIGGIGRRGGERR